MKHLKILSQTALAMMMVFSTKAVFADYTVDKLSFCNVCLTRGVSLHRKSGVCDIDPAHPERNYPHVIPLTPGGPWPAIPQTPHAKYVWLVETDTTKVPFYLFARKDMASIASQVPFIRENPGKKASETGDRFLFTYSSMVPVTAKTKFAHKTFIFTVLFADKPSYFGQAYCAARILKNNQGG